MRLYSIGDKSIKIYYGFQEKDNWTAKCCPRRLCIIYIGQVFFIYLGFLSSPFTFHTAAREEGDYLYNSSLPFPPTSQILRY